METIVLHQSKTAQIWRAGGMIWLISITLFFALLDLYFAKLSALFTTGIGLITTAITVFLFIWSIKTMSLAKRLPVEKSDADTVKGNKMRKWFLIILVLEVALLNIATFMLLKLNHLQYIVPVDILIVSLHFIPLARIFAVPIYYLLGIIMSVITILTMLLVPISSQIGNLSTLAGLPSLCFIFFNWIVIVYILKDSMKYLKV